MKLEIEEEEIMAGFVFIGIAIIVCFFTFIWIPSCNKEEEAERQHEIKMQEIKKSAR